MKQWISTCLLLALGFLAPNLIAQDVHITPRPEPKNEKQTDDPSLNTHTKPIRKDVDLVLVPVQVLDPMGRMVTGLEKDNFQVSEDGKPQTIKHFSSDDAPISLGIIFDVSGSMADKIDKAKEAVIEFCKTSNIQDKFFIIAFSDRPELISDFATSDEAQGRLVYAVPKGRTALLDAIYMGIAKMKDAKQTRKAILIVSDGGDNRSRYTEGEIKSFVKEADVMIYAIGIFDFGEARTPEERNGPYLLGEIADSTGGRLLRADSPNELPNIALNISMELRNQYTLGYKPTNQTRDGNWRKLKVKILAPKGLPPLTPYARKGYYAPAE